MILNTGQRTDIPAFYSDWLINRIHAGFVLVRNPWYPQQVTRYRIDPSVVDLIAFCSKNPAPMIPKLPEIAAYRQFWHVTITPYGRDLEPHVPPVQEVMETFRTLSQIVGSSHIVWRYDPIIITDRYTVDFHIDAFRKMCEPDQMVYRADGDGAFSLSDRTTESLSVGPIPLVQFTAKLVKYVHHKYNSDRLLAARRACHKEAG